MEIDESSTLTIVFQRQGVLKDSPERLLARKDHEKPAEGEARCSCDFRIAT